MRLDYHDATRKFTLNVQRWEADAGQIMKEHGLDRSTVLSNDLEDVLFTPEPYAAVAFYEYATERAQAALAQLQAEIEGSWAKESGAHIDCPADLELSPFQKAGVEYCLRRNNALIGDQPGLGKTMQAICLANEMKAKRVLILCPANIRLQWVKRIREWTTLRWPFTVYPILHGKHGVHPDAAYTVVSYDLARTPSIGRALAKGHYDLLVLDEAHYLKTIDSKRTRAVFGGGDAPEFEYLSARAAYTLALTGTPLPNRPREAYTLARGLCFDSIDWMSEDRFSMRFNPSEQRETAAGKLYIKEDVGRSGELQARLRANFMVRRLKREVLPQLKLPALDIVHVDEDAHVKAALKAESMLDIDPENLEGVDATLLGQVSTVRRMMGIAIAPHAADYVDMLLQGGEDKVVVFAWHTQVLDILEKNLARYHPLRIDGSTSATRKQGIIEAFKNPRHHLLLGNLLSMGTGTDGLQEVCQRGVAAECDWTPGNNEQAIDRLDRMGQEGSVLFDFLVARGSFSERVLGTSLRKKQQTHLALDRRM